MIGGPQYQEQTFRGQKKGRKQKTGRTNKKQRFLPVSDPLFPRAPGKKYAVRARPLTPTLPHRLAEQSRPPLRSCSCSRPGQSTPRSWQLPALLLVLLRWWRPGRAPGIRENHVRQGAPLRGTLWEVPPERYPLGAPPEGYPLGAPLGGTP